MAAIETMSNMEKMVLVKTLGLFILHDEGLPLEVESLQKLVKASGFTYDQTIASLLCKSLQSMDIK
jgi:ribosomal protein L12E/L44/L45/RPP1/RPP2